MQTPLKGLLFDNDGVLVDSMPGASQAWVLWGERYHHGFDLSPAYHGRRASDIVAELVTEEKFQGALEYINQLELDQAHSTTALSGTLELLASLPDGSWNIVTGANLELARARLSAAGIVAPQALVTADDGEKGKPDPEPYLLGAQKIGVPIAECVVFEDAPAGLVAGKLAGAALLVGIGEQTLDSVADLVIVSLAGLKYSFGLLEIPDEVRLR
jgi:sugar-phosphatase